MPGPRADAAQVLAETTIVNEFTGVRVRKLLTRNGERLEVESMRLGYRIRLDALGLERVSLVGNSLGGRMALDMAERHPDRVTRMVLMGSPGVGMAVTDGLKALRAYEPSLENMRALLLDYFAVDKSIITDDLVRIRYEASVETFEAYRSMFSDPRHKGNELGITEEQARSIRTPALLVHGREDKVVPAEVSWTMLQLLQDADLHVFARCGHWTQIERAREFVEVVSSFLRS